MGDTARHRRAAARLSLDATKRACYSGYKFWLERHAMARSTWSLQDAKNQFSAVVEAARRRPQTVTKHGKPAVVVVAAEDYARLARLDRLTTPDFAAHLLEMPTDDGAFEPLGRRLRGAKF
jgi:antitoxin Phd